MHVAKSQIAWLQAIPIIHHFSDKELERFARRYGRASDCMEIRVFPWWIWPKTKTEDFYLPWKKNTLGQFDWNRPDLRYDDNFKRLKKIVWHTKLYPNDPDDNRKAKIPIRFSFLDHCANKGVLDKNNPWINNIHGPDGMYDAETFGKQAIKELWIDRLWDMGVRLFDGGNEIKCPQEPHVPRVNQWVRYTYMPYIKYLLDKGAKPVFTFSASEKTAHSIRGWIGDTVSPGIMCQMIHGQMLPELVPPKKKFSTRFYYGLSCDGLNTRKMNIPDNRKGLITDNGKYQDSAEREHRYSVAQIVEALKPGKVRFWEHLPRGIDSLQSPGHIREHEDVSVCWRVPLHVYGIDLRQRPLEKGII